jgi:hypothetical protein
MSDVIVMWNEFVTYEARISREAMDRAVEAKDNGSIGDYWSIVFDAACPVCEIVDSGGMDNISFYDENREELSV